ncbi:MAG: hypothetical protein ACTHMM_04175 [Agriterribacter sp.]
MKNLAFGLLILISASCSNTSKMSTSGLKGKLVVSELCAHYVVELTGGSIPADKTAANWKDDKRSQTYPVAFTVANRCSFEKAGLKEGDEFSFVLDESSEPETCAVCMAYYPTPPQALAIKDIKKLTENQ